MSICDDPLFNRYSDEPVFYMAHPLAPDDRFTFQQNMDHVVEMMRFFYSISVRVIAPYHTMCLAMSDDKPEDRRVGLEVDLTVIRRLGRLILVGHKISSGMKDELLAAKESFSENNVLNFVGWSRRDICRYFDSQREATAIATEHGIRVFKPATIFHSLPETVPKLVTNVPRLDSASLGST